MIIIFWISLLVLIPPVEGPSPEEVCLTREEIKLLTLINQYRTDHGLPGIRPSRSLTIVAKHHSRDMVRHKPDKHPRCNMHSWSDNGDWTSCCYTEDHEQAECMWLKPAELTDYKGHGYEIAFGNAGSRYAAEHVHAEEAFNSWIKSKPHRAVIMNRGIWKDTQWKAIGVGIYKGYACIWFGRIPDAHPVPGNCTDK